MSEIRSVLKAFTSVYVARILAAGLVFLSTVIIARTLGPDDFAVFATIAAVISVASGLVGPALDTTLVRFAATNGDRTGDAPGAHARVIFTSKFVLSLAILVAGFGIGPLLSRLLLGASADAAGARAAMMLGFATAAFVTLWTSFQSYAQARQKFTMYAGMEFSAAALRLALIAGAVLAGYREVLSMVACNAIAGLLLVIGCVATTRVRRPIATMTEVQAVSGELFTFAKWVLAASCCTALFQRLDIFFLAYLRYPETQIGHYGAAVQLMLAVEMAVLTMFNVLLPKASTLRTRSEFRGFMRQFRLLSIGLAVSMLPLVFLSGWIARIVFGPGYDETGTFLFVLLLGSLASLAFAPAGAVLYAMGESHYIAFLEAAKLVLFVCAGAYAAVYHGALEVAMTLSLVKALISVSTYLIARHEAARVLP